MSSSKDQGLLTFRIPKKKLAWTSRSCLPMSCLGAPYTRSRGLRDTRYEWASLSGTVCPERGAAVDLVLPFANTEAMNAHLAEICRPVTPVAHALPVLDGAGWGAGWHGSKGLARVPFPNDLAVLCVQAESRRTHLAVSARQQARDHCLR